MSSVHRNMQLWRKRSKEHKEKFQKLITMPPDKITEIKNFVVCTEDEFMVGPSTDQHGTCVFIGLEHGGTEVAVKRMLTDSCENLVETETKIFGMLKMGKSPHVVRYLSSGISEGPFTYIVLELCEYSLVEYVERARRNDHIPFDPRRIIKEILMGLETLHKRGYNEEEMILHRDLKPRNVLVDLEYNIRLADFGVSKNIGKGSTSKNYTFAKGGRDSIWQAAESIPKNDDQSDKVNYRRKSDIQVAGMLAYYVLTKGEHPFGDVDHIRRTNIVNGKPVHLNVSDAVAKDLVSWLLQHEIDDRPFADEALMHPYFLSIKDQFALLHDVGNEQEVIKNKSCYVVDHLNSYSGTYSHGWRAELPEEIIQAFRKRSYDDNLTSLLRFMRNVTEHITDQSIPQSVRDCIGDPAEYFLRNDKFSELPMVVHKILRKEAKIVTEGEGNAKKWIDRLKLKRFFCKYEDAKV